MSGPTFSEFESASRAQGYEQVLVREWAASRTVGVHTHPFDVSARVVRGEFTLRCQGKDLMLGAGQTFTLARDTPHEELYGPQGATVWVARRGPTE